MSEIITILLYSALVVTWLAMSIAMTSDWLENVTFNTQTLLVFTILAMLVVSACTWPFYLIKCIYDSIPTLNSSSYIDD